MTKIMGEGIATWAFTAPLPVLRGPTHQAHKEGAEPAGKCLL